MFIICKNDFPFLVCPTDVSLAFARKITEHFQKECGLQLGLSSPIHYHLRDVSVITQVLIKQIKLENEKKKEEEEQIICQQDKDEPDGGAYREYQFT